MSNVYEREFLLKESRTEPTAFKYRPIERLATSRAPATILTIETNHIKRTPLEKHASGIVPMLEYQLWLEAGKLRKANYKSEKNNPDTKHNSNIWRNFRTSCGFTTSPRGNVSESVAALFPINIPPPSKVGSNTLSKFYDEHKKHLFRSHKAYELAVEKTERDDALMKYLKLKSEARNPPLDSKGNILPPANFKKYPYVQLPKNLNEAKSQSFDMIEQNEFGLIMNSKSATKRHSPSKMSFRENHPDYEKFLAEQRVKGLLPTE